MDESVYSLDLDDEYNAAPPIERVGWALSHAGDAQRRERVREWRPVRRPAPEQRAIEADVCLGEE
jgi:hypothetical protein